ncbi:MAG: Fructosamine/Ketosamine-3-kinase, partial [Solirubrobacterales bacterium]|nr:Fructosamine/Ketosamine-3-kinase [Solirubrobacterales bacterium]
FGATGPRALARFGSLGLPNDPAADWPTFYAERRLRPLARIASARQALPQSAIDAIERLCERLPELAGPPERPARLHGDLWSGNVMAGADGRPWLIDPSAYGGHREVDLAMLRLFGAPSERVFAAYDELTPLAPGWEERVELYQLLPLLVHALLFGGSYRSAAERVALRYAG